MEVTSGTTVMHINVVQEKGTNFMGMDDVQDQGIVLNFQSSQGLQNPLVSPNVLDFGDPNDSADLQDDIVLADSAKEVLAFGNQLGLLRIWVCSNDPLRKLLLRILQKVVAKRIKRRLNQLGSCWWTLGLLRPLMLTFPNLFNDYSLGMQGC